MKLTEGLFDDNAGFLRGPVNDGWGDEETLRGLDLTTYCDFPALALDVGKEGLHALILHLILERAVGDTVLGPVTDLEGLHGLDKGALEGFKDGLVDVDALQVQANLWKLCQCIAFFWVSDGYA